MGAHRSHSVSYPLSLQSGSVRPMAGLQGTPLTASSPCSCVNKGPGFGASPGDPSARWRSRAGAAGLSEAGCWSCRCPAAPCSRHQRSLLFPLVAASMGSSELFRSRSPQGPEFEECGPSWVHTHSASMLGSAPGFRSGRGCRTEKGPEKGLGKGLARPWRAPHWRGYLN